MSRDLIQRKMNFIKKENPGACLVLRLDAFESHCLVQRVTFKVLQDTSQISSFPWTIDLGFKSGH